MYKLTPKISLRMSGLNPSAIREIFKFIGAPGMISFAGGNPSELTFPSKELGGISAELFFENPAAFLQYGISEGYGPLREQTRARLREKFAISAENDDIIIVSGGQQAIDLAMKTLTNEGDTVLCESPSFVGALNTIRSYNVRLVGVRMDSGGMDISALEKALETEKNVRLIYTIPTFQNPMGVTMSLERRKRLYELAVKYNAIILEDDPYRELRYYGQDVPAIKSLDQTGHVVYCGSYSKTVAPGLRVGYAVLDRSIFQKYTVAKQCSDVHTNSFAQLLIARYLEKFDFDAHLDQCRDIYRTQRDLMVNGLSEKLSDVQGASFTQPDGGLFIWASLPAEFSGKALFEQLIERGLATVPGGTFDPLGGDLPGVRLNFSMPPPEQIVKGTEIFGNTIKEFLS